MVLAADEPYCLRDLLADDGVDTPSGDPEVAGQRKDRANAHVVN